MDNQAQDLSKEIPLLSRYYRSEKNIKKKGKRKDIYERNQIDNKKRNSRKPFKRFNLIMKIEKL